MISFFRVIRFALQDIMRNFSLSFMTVLILVLMLLSINTLIIMRVVTAEGAVRAELPDGPLDCEWAVREWRRVAEGATMVGIRYAAGSLTLVSDTGGSLTLEVVRARREG